MSDQPIRVRDPIVLTLFKAVLLLTAAALVGVMLHAVWRAFML